MDPAAIAFAWRPVSEDFGFRQNVLAGSVQGHMLEDRAAGPIGIAAGVEYRAERGKVTHGGIDASDYAFSFGLDYAGRTEVLEEFLETNVPILRDSSFGRLLEFNGAVRHTGNKSTDRITNGSRSIDAVSWKLGGVYEAVAGVRLRATQSRDIRAAGFRELFQKTSPTEEGTAQGRVNNPNIQGPNPADPTPIYSGGNFALTPEKANTTTIGMVLAPASVPGFSLSLDWYRIKLRDTIANLNGQRVVDLCFSYRLMCDRITFASPTNIIRVDAGQANVGKIDIRGVDFEASYRLALTDLSARLPGDLSVRFLLNHQYNFLLKQNAAAPTIDYAGQAGTVLEGGDFYPSPEWMWNAVIGYDVGRLTTTMLVRHVGKGVLNVTLTGPEDEGYSPTLPGSITTNRVPARTYVNLAMSYALLRGGDGKPNIDIFGSVENLFDRKPPIAPGGLNNSVSSPYPTNPVFFDTFGTRFRAGVRAQF
jgi:outer membrane receptor protein involved in Fe transport